MTMLEGLRTDERTEAAFRRGYQKGAQGLIEALDGVLPDATVKQLRAWSEQQLDEWRLSPATGRETSPTPPEL